MRCGENGEERAVCRCAGPARPRAIVSDRSARKTARSQTTPNSVMVRRFLVLLVLFLAGAVKATCAIAFPEAASWSPKRAIVPPVQAVCRRKAAQPRFGLLEGRDESREVNKKENATGILPYLWNRTKYCLHVVVDVREGLYVFLILQFVAVNIALSGPCNFLGDSDFVYRLRCVFDATMSFAKPFVAFELGIFAVFFAAILTCDMFYGKDQGDAVISTIKRKKRRKDSKQ